MKAIQHPARTIQFPVYTQKTSLLRRFLTWCGTQEQNRLLWLALIITAHGCVITPVTLGFVMLFGNNFIFWPWAIAAMAMSLIVNLAAMPTKVTLPVFFLSLLIDLVIIVGSLSL